MTTPESGAELQEIIRLLLRLCSAQERILVSLIDLAQEQHEMKALLTLFIGRHLGA